MRSSGELELHQLALVSGDDAGEVHHLGQPEHPAAAEEALEIARQKRATRRLEPRGRDAGGRHEEEVERQSLARVEQPVDAVGTEHVCELVRVGDDRSGAEREHQPRELVG